MNLVARCCEEGWGTARDLDAAALWYRRSAEGGYFRGQYNWATLLLRRGYAAEAAYWFERAATGGSAGVREAVATCCSLGSTPASIRAATMPCCASRLD